MSLFAELKRRNVFRVGIAYVIVAWLVLQVADVILNNITAPDWVFQVIMLVLGIGLPVVLVFAWAFELTPEGIKRDKDVDRSESITPQTGKKLNTAILVLMALAIVYLLFDKFATPPTAGHSTVAGQAGEVEQGPRTIAVLPLVNMSADQANEYFADGLTEELLNILAKISDLRVAGRTSAFAFKGKNEDLREIAEKLSVETILEGSVRKDDERVRITLQLVNAADGYHLWSETYDRQLEDIFAVQEDIAREVAQALRITLLGDDEQAIGQTNSADLTAYDLYLQGLQQFHEESYASLTAATETFQRAIERDPDYRPTQLRLADTWIALAWTGAIKRSEAVEKASPLIERILEADPRNDEAHTLMGALHRLQGSQAEAREELQRALDINPRNVAALSELGRSVFGSGEAARGVEYMREAHRLDPYSPQTLWDMTYSNAVMQRTDEAVMFARKIGEVQPDNPSQYWGQALAHAFNGDLGLSLLNYQKAHELDPDDYENSSGSALIWLDLGDAERAEEWIKIADAIGADQPMPIFARIKMYQFREQPGLAADLAQRALARELDNRGGSNNNFRWTWIADLYRRGQYQAALEWYRQENPGFFESPPDYELNDPFGGRTLVEIAVLLKASDPGSEQIASLIDAAEQKLNGFEASLFPWQQLVTRAAIAAARDHRTEAIELLFQAYDRGMRNNWRAFMEVWIGLQSLHDEPEYQRLVTLLEEDMDRQRERAYELLEVGP